MKILKLIFLGMVIAFSGQIKAQVSVNVSIGSPPMWGPVGYSEVRYYYLPDVESYYDVQTSMFVFYEGGAWVHRRSLPGRYASYDLYNGYKVVMPEYRGETPYTEFKEHKAKYGKGYHGGAQKTIGERPGRGNSGEQERHGNEGNQRAEGHGNDRGEGHGNEKNSKQERGHEEGHGGREQGHGEGHGGGHEGGKDKK